MSAANATGVPPRIRIFQTAPPQQFVVEQLDVEGLVTESSHYARDDFPQAATEYSQRFIDATEASIAPAIAVAQQSLAAASGTDFDALRSLMHDDSRWSTIVRSETPT